MIEPRLGADLPLSGSWEKAPGDGYKIKVHREVGSPTFLMTFPCHCKSMLSSHNWLTWQMFKCLRIWNRDRTEMGFLLSALCSAPRLKSWGSLDETFVFSAAVENHSVRTMRVCTLAGLPTSVELSCLPTALRYVWVYTAAHEKCYNSCLSVRSWAF